MNVGFLSITGLQQIVLNHQGQQILVQRAAPSSQPQNIVLRTASGQSSILQLPQQATSATQQIHSAAQQLQVRTAEEKQVNIASEKSVAFNFCLQNNWRKT